MKHLRLPFAAGILTIVFAASTASAGQMPYGDTSPPPPTENSTTGNMPYGNNSSSPSTEAPVTGEMPLGVTSAIDPVTEFTLSLLQSLFALF